MIIVRNSVAGRIVARGDIVPSGYRDVSSDCGTLANRCALVTIYIIHKTFSRCSRSGIVGDYCRVHDEMIEHNACLTKDRDRKFRLRREVVT